jgi:hypothetical protein
MPLLACPPEFTSSSITASRIFCKDRSAAGINTAAQDQPAESQQQKEWGKQDSSGTVPAAQASLLLLQTTFPLPVGQRCRRLPEAGSYESFVSAREHLSNPDQHYSRKKFRGQRRSLLVLSRRHDIFFCILPLQLCR